MTICVGYLLNKTLDSNDSVLVIKPQVDKNTTDIKELEQWQKDWVKSGRLPEDVEQNKEIEFLKRDLGRVDDEVTSIENRVRDVEMSNTKDH